MNSQSNDTPATTPPSLPDILLPHLQRSAADPRPVVLMTCGIAGAGKSTLSKSVLSNFPTFTRLSIDVIVHARHGLYAIDYPAAMHETYQNEADAEFRRNFAELMEQGRDVVLDRAFYAREDRDEFRRVAGDAGARCVLVCLDATREVLWRRIQERRAKGRDADSAFDVTEEVLDRYLAGFEWPDGEGEIRIQVT